LEAAPTDGVFAAGAVGPWATNVAKCGAGSSSCQTNSIYTQTGVDLATIKGLYRGLAGGQAATNAIIAKHPLVVLNTFAAGVADSYIAPSFNGVTKDDYYLPTKDELQLMQKNLNNVGIGEFVSGRYWSSSEFTENIAGTQSFDNGSQSNSPKSNNVSVRPVRRF
jgi:hypothetical protein